MKNVIVSLINHKDLYVFSISVGAIISYIFGLITTFNSMLIFGTNVSLWIIALMVNIVDIHTGIKADTKRKLDNDERFKFESRKGWRAFEKIFIFTIIVWFIYTLEIEALRLQFYGFIPSLLLTIKFSLLIYVILVELQSIGENEEVRFGKKSKAFKMLDSIIEIVNEGIIKNLKKLFV